MKLHALPFSFFKIHLGIILPFMPRLSYTLFPSHILTKPLCVFLSSPQLFHVPHPPHLHLIPLVKEIKWRWATQYSVLFSFLKLPLDPRYIPQHPILKHLQPMFFPKYDQPCFTPIYNNRHSIFTNDIPLWYMMINHKDTYINLFLAACFDCCEKQIIILQCCNENIMYILIPLQSFSTKPNM